MIPNSQISKIYACSSTKCTAIVKEALAPYFSKLLNQSLINNPFSLLIDESNDRKNKACIILVRVLDPDIGDIRTRFLDIPIVNVGMASKLFTALKSLLNNFGIDFQMLWHLCQTQQM